MRRVKQCPKMDPKSAFLSTSKFANLRALTQSNTTAVACAGQWASECNFSPSGIWTSGTVLRDPVPVFGLLNLLTQKSTLKIFFRHMASNSQAAPSSLYRTFQWVVWPSNWSSFGRGFVSMMHTVPRHWLVPLAKTGVPA